jgi:hypothetical protein
MRQVESPPSAGLCSEMLPCSAERPSHPPPMFVVTEEDAAAIRTAFEQEGELSAAIEVRRRFLGITDNAKAWEQARTIAGWKPWRATPSPVKRSRPGGRRWPGSVTPSSSDATNRTGRAACCAGLRCAEPIASDNGSSHFSMP